MQNSDQDLLARLKVAEALLDELTTCFLADESEEGYQERTLELARRLVRYVHEKRAALLKQGRTH